MASTNGSLRRKQYASPGDLNLSAGSLSPRSTSSQSTQTTEPSPLPLETMPSQTMPLMKRKQSSPMMPSFMVSAPGKVIVYGEHAVVHGKACHPWNTVSLVTNRL